jgi:hypothetical protein
MDRVASASVPQPRTGATWNSSRYLLTNALGESLWKSLSSALWPACSRRHTAIPNPTHPAKTTQASTHCKAISRSLSIPERIHHFQLADWVYAQFPRELNTTRKPKLPVRYVGSKRYLCADRQQFKKLPQPPPRRTRDDPLFGPTGSVSARFGYGPYQSKHHSQTFPCMSYKLHPFDFFRPTG